MRAAVSIPDDVFEKAERLARRSKRSRNELYTAALREYLARHAGDEVTEALNRTCGVAGDVSRCFIGAACRRVIESSEWASHRWAGERIPEPQYGVYLHFDTQPCACHLTVAAVMH
jgi:hypothetical protein